MCLRITGVDLEGQQGSKGFSKDDFDYMYFAKTLFSALVNILSYAINFFFLNI